jgi:hypothetical protein
MRRASAREDIPDPRQGAKLAKRLNAFLHLAFLASWRETVRYEKQKPVKVEMSPGRQGGFGVFGALIQSATGVAGGN